jgi:hypothetical protein
MVNKENRTYRPVYLSSIMLAAFSLFSCGPGQSVSERAPAAGSPGTVKWGHVELTEGPMNSVLLKDYAPASSLVVPEHQVPRASIPVIDVHTHVYAETPEEIRQWVDTMDRVGIRTTVVLTRATGKEFDQLASLYLEPWPERFQLYCGLLTENIADPGYPQKAAEELERCYSMGARGVGELVDKGWGFGSNEDNPLPRQERLFLIGESGRNNESICLRYLWIQV